MSIRGRGTDGFFVAVLLLSISVATLACSSEGEGGGLYDRATGASGVDGTRRMISVLDSLREEAVAHPEQYVYMNKLRAEMWRRRAEETTGMPQRKAQFFYASELLNAGETESAIQVFEELLGDTSYAITAESRMILDMLAVSYLRLGEQQNCIHHHTAESCILPLRGGGIHRIRHGSQRARSIYERLLFLSPGDLQARWLYNVAAMTLGTYPHGVPGSLLIPGFEKPSTTSLARFENVAPALGVDVNGLSGGVSLEDFNGDGLIDIFATSYGIDDPVRLFLADGRGGFVDHTRAAGLRGIVSGLNTVHADYDNDGHVDVLILRGAWLGDAGAHPNSLLKNNGDGTFEDVTFEAGLGCAHPTQTAAWADFNDDGWLDLFVGNEHSDRWQSVWDTAPGGVETATKEHRSELFVNNGDGTFTEVAVRVGIDLKAFVKGAAWGDVNNDGLPDLYVSVMGGPNRLYINRGGTELSDWRFDERAAEAGVQEPVFSFPTWFWDYDNDGWEDLFVAPYDLRRIRETPVDVAREYLGLPTTNEKPRLYRNNGDGTFADVTEEAGLDKVLYAMGANFGDLNNDGFQDFYVGTGAPDLRAVIPNRMFRNVDGRYFEEVTVEGGFGHIQKGHGIAFADLDRDGDQDVYGVMGGSVEGDTFQNVLFENPGPNPDHAWITLQLEGRSANRSAVGTRIKLIVRDGQGGLHTIHRAVSTGGSFGSSSLQQEIGLGSTDRIVQLEIRWPGPAGTVDTYADLPVNQHLLIKEEASSPSVRPAQAVPFKREGVRHAAHEQP